jgi:hypothetical protein
MDQTEEGCEMYGSWQHLQHNGDVEFWRKAKLNNVDGIDSSYDSVTHSRGQNAREAETQTGCPKF